jgi:hypothetical protein
VNSRLLAVAAGALLVAATPAVAWAQDANTPLAVAIDSSQCGAATIVYTNNNTNPFSGDYRVDQEQGFNDEFSNLIVEEGPFAGNVFGERYHPVDLPAGQTVTVALEFEEDQSEGEVSVAAWVNRGPEQNAYAAVVTAAVDTDCEEPVDPTTEPEPTDEPDPTTEPEPTEEPEPTQEPDPTTGPVDLGDGFSQVGQVPTGGVDTGDGSTL